jgi:hypothetical protein
VKFAASRSSRKPLNSDFCDDCADDDDPCVEGQSIPHTVVNQVERISRFGLVANKLALTNANIKEVANSRFKRLIIIVLWLLG